MENQETNEKTLGELILPALTQFFYMLVFILFLCPFNFWKKAVMRLSEARNSSSWDFAKSTSRWPVLSFLKAILLNFIFDGAIFISYFAGVLCAIYLMIQAGFGAFIGALIVTYYVPIIISPLRDIFVISLLPFSKFLSWCARPAQYLEIDMNNK